MSAVGVAAVCAAGKSVKGGERGRVDSERQQNQGGQQAHLQLPNGRHDASTVAGGWLFRGRGDFRRRGCQAVEQGRREGEQATFGFGKVGGECAGDPGVLTLGVGGEKLPPLRRDGNEALAPVGVARCAGDELARFEVRHDAGKRLRGEAFKAREFRRGHRRGGAIEAAEDD